RRKPGRLRLQTVQIDTTRFCRKTIKNQGVQNRTYSVNRTAVIEQLYEIGEDGIWSSAAQGKGSLIAGDQIQSIELWPITTDDEELS
ncbi:MAG: hypothetical protein OEL53_11425, partial [Rhodospirillales bacterium]|nr:hypothetical protein [Rhodospirillales bacterium]